MVCDGVQSCKGTASFLKNRSPLPNFALKVMEMKASTFAIIDLNRNLRETFRYKGYRVI